MNPWLPHPGVPVDQADPASCTAASVSSQSGSDDTVPNLTEADVRESLGLIKPSSQEKITGLWHTEIDEQVAAWRKMVLADELTPMADRVEMVLRDEKRLRESIVKKKIDEKRLRESIVKEKIDEVMQVITASSMKDPSMFGVSNIKMGADGQTYTYDITLPVPLDYIRLNLKL